jgi:enamine deaminase RidA (YjgF/YER057c/UK114 family)
VSYNSGHENFPYRILHPRWKPLRRSANPVSQAGRNCSRNRYTHVVVTSPGRLVFIAGQIARDKQGNLVGKGDLHAQTVQVFENLKAALAAAGATFNDVVKINWYIRDYKPESLAALREVRAMYVNKDNPPASTLIGVAALAQEDYLIEVEAVAALPDQHGKKK